MSHYSSAKIESTNCKSHKLQLKLDNKNDKQKDLYFYRAIKGLNENPRKSDISCSFQVNVKTYFRDDID